MGFFRKIWNRMKEKKKDAEEVDAILVRAYKEQMREEAVKMGTIKAKIDAESKIKNYKEKMNSAAANHSANHSTTHSVDPFGLHREEQKGGYNIITGK